MTRPDFDAYADLIEEFSVWCSAQGLPQLSADELVAELQLTETPEAATQRAWLFDFIERWEAI